MTRISIKHPSGFEITFDGDAEEFERFRSFVTDDLSGLMTTLPAPSIEAQLPPSTELELDPVSPEAISARLSKVGASADIERITVIADAATEANGRGLDYDTVDRLYDSLGIKKPPRWRATFSNAKQKGYLQSVGQGLWKPTVMGQNFARLGHRS